MKAATPSERAAVVYLPTFKIHRVVSDGHGYLNARCMGDEVWNPYHWWGSGWFPLNQRLAAGKPTYCRRCYPLRRPAAT